MNTRRIFHVGKSYFTKMFSKRILSKIKISTIGIDLSISKKILSKTSNSMKRLFSKKSLSKTSNSMKRFFSKNILSKDLVQFARKKYFSRRSVFGSFSSTIASLRILFKRMCKSAGRILFTNKKSKNIIARRINIARRKSASQHEHVRETQKDLRVNKEWTRVAVLQTSIQLVRKNVLERIGQVKSGGCMAISNIIYSKCGDFKL